MSVSLSKGGNVSLSKTAPSMKNVLVGLGWDARSTDGQDFDLDASAFLLAANGKVRGDADFIFYNNLKSLMVPLLIPVITVPVKVMATMNPSKSNWTRYLGMSTKLFSLSLSMMLRLVARASVRFPAHLSVW